MHVNVKSGIYHGPGCQFYDCKNCTLEVSSAQAQSMGYRHCKRE